jgi:hypothetical protein
LFNGGELKSDATFFVLSFSVDICGGVIPPLKSKLTKLAFSLVPIL